MPINTASAVFDTRSEAEQAIRDLRRAGVPDASFSVIAQGDAATAAGDDVADEGHGNILRGILGGGALGAGLGVAALAIPGVGPLVAAGAIAASAVPGAVALGAAAGAVGGTLNETLASHGVDPDDADYYSDRLGQGGTLVTVGPVDGVSSEEVHDILYRNGGHSAKRSRVATY